MSKFLTEFKVRLLAATMLITVTLGLLVWASQPILQLSLLLVFAIAAWEWSFLSSLYATKNRLFYVTIVILSIFIAKWLPMSWLVRVSLLFWILGAFLVVRYPHLPSWWRNGPWARAFFGCVVLATAALSLEHLAAQPGGRLYIFILLCMTWAVDSGAYLAGRRFGKHALMPMVSPRKTVEGFLGGMLAVTIIIMTLMLFSNALRAVWWIWLTLGVVITLVAVMGDLFESMLKRQTGIKDSGSLIPGHGGVLDRIDSLLATAPVFVMGYWMFGLSL